MEREVKLSVPEGFRRPPLDGSGGAAAGAVLTRRYTTTYHDTSDLALAAWACSLRYRSGEGWTVKLAPATLGPLMARSEHTFEGPPGTPPPGALALLTGYLRGRAVAPVARATTTRRSQTLVDPEGRPALEVVDDTVVSLDGPGSRRLRQIEVEVREERATDVLDGVLGRLRRAGAQVGDARTKYEWLLADRRPAPEVVVPTLTPDSSLGDAIRAILGRSVTKLINAEAAFRAGDDPEAIHDARVATRRLRSDLRSFAEVLEADWSGRLRDELGWAGDALGAVRDPEVLAGRIGGDARRLDEPGVADAIVATLLAEVAAARSTLGDIVSGQRYLALLQRLVLAARSPVFRVPADGPATELLAPAVDRAWRRLRKATREAASDPTDAGLHLVRIRAKQARYAAESLAPLLGKAAVRFAQRATRLQDALGEHQDAVVAWARLRDAAKAAEAGEAFVAGQLAGLELEARQRARDGWPKAWKALRQVRPSTWQ